MGCEQEDKKVDHLSQFKNYDMEMEENSENDSKDLE